MNHFLGQPALHNEQNSLPSKILLNQSINKPINKYNLFKKKKKLKPELAIYLSGYKNAMSSHHHHPAQASQSGIVQEVKAVGLGIQSRPQLQSKF